MITSMAHMMPTLKYMVAGIMLTLVILAPAYLAVQTNKGKTDAMKIRIASWLFGWTIIGWFLALIWAIKK